jgi:AcrR family transcriptional regulator
VRQITLTDIADAVGMHRSALLRYFETREQIFLILTAEGWREWSSTPRSELAQLEKLSAATVAAIFSKTLTARPVFCDLLAQAPLNLERNVSLDAVRAFKHDCHRHEHGRALWQMATPGPQVSALCRTEPELAHAIVEVEPRLTHILEGLLAGYLTERVKR